MTQSSSDVTTDIVGITQSEGIEGLRNFFDQIAETDLFGGRTDMSHEEYQGFVKKTDQTISSDFKSKKFNKW